MTWRRSVLGAAGAAVLLAAVVFGGGQWLGANFGGALQPGGIAPEDLNAWVDNALVSVIGETGRGARAADWEPLQVEACGTTAIAFYAERDPDSLRAYRWAVGEPGRLPVVSSGGLTGTLAEARIAAMRASLPVCSTVLDPGIGEAQARDALLGARDAWVVEVGMDARLQPPIPEAEILADAQVTNMSPMGRNLYGVVIAYREDTRQRLQRVTLSGMADGGFDVQNASFDVGGASPLVVYRDPISSAPSYFALTGDAQAAAVEFIGPGVVLRYPVRGTGFMLEGIVPADEVTDYRFLGVDGQVLAAGRIEVWCPAPESDAFTLSLPGC